ncbi:MAG: glycosyltransferase family 1 protein [Acidobacteria bacterium]|nr:MAG: glycosyltransferase family 1 protein [Acidobacteriota bacterium]
MKTVVICSVSVPLFSGGAERLAGCLRDEFAKRGFDADVVHVPFRWYPRNALLSQALIWRLLDLRESNGRAVDLLVCLKFPCYLAEHDRKVVYLAHQFRQVYDLYGTQYSDFTASAHDTWVRDKIIGMDSRFLPTARRIFTNTKNTAGRLRRFNGIEARPLPHPPKDANRFYCAGYEPYVLSVGRLDALKRVDLLIRSLPRVSGSLRAVIVGDGPQREHLERIAHDCGVSRRVHFTGAVSDEGLLTLYADARAVYYAPYDEDYGLVTIEAFLSRKPVITADDSGGVLEFVQDGVNGHVVPPDADAMAGALDRLAADVPRCRRFGEAGYELARTITWDDVIGRLLS